MTLRDQIEDDLTGIFLNEDDFAERFIYYPKEGKSREIVGVRKSVTQANTQHDHHETQDDQITVLVTLDAVTGIPDPKVGDAIRPIASRRDERWGYVKVEDRDHCSLIAVFKKSTLASAGYRHRPSL